MYTCNSHAREYASQCESAQEENFDGDNQRISLCDPVNMDFRRGGAGETETAGNRSCRLFLPEDALFLT
jgi:hypothetical protein